MAKLKTAAIAAKTEQNPQERVFVYVGPTLPGGLLNKNTVFFGSFDEVTTCLADLIHKQPAVKRLLVPVSQLSVAKKSIRIGTNILSKAYQELS